MRSVALDVLDDLLAEYGELDAVLAALEDPAWDRDTPAVGFTVRHQVHHLAFSEELASRAAADPDAFRLRLAVIMSDIDAAGLQPDDLRTRNPRTLLSAWRDWRSVTVAALRRHDPGDRIPWVMGEMSVTSFTTARLMETWAHGQDVYDALGLTRTPTSRLRHIAHLGVTTRRFSYLNRGLEPPSVDVRVELVAPDGTTWEWGDIDAIDRVTGPALDFCLVVTQRRHRADTALRIEGDRAQKWMSIAQAFAGPPTDGRTEGGSP